MSVQIDLSGQVAVVTGASRGIGAAIAAQLSAAGATVVGTATSEAGAAGISERIGDGRVLDVRDAEAGAALLSDVAKAHGAVTILVNNAGITRDNLLMRMTDAHWDEIIETNLTPIFRLSKAVLRGMMKARSGRIINISSIVGATGNAGQANYAAAKAGLIGFTKSMAQEIGSRQVTVNAIAPGFIRSDMTDALPESTRDQLQGQIALGRLGEVDEVAHSALFLASPLANYITGHTLHVNGGMYMN